MRTCSSIFASVVTLALLSPFALGCSSSESSQEEAGNDTDGGIPSDATTDTTADGAGGGSGGSGGSDGGLLDTGTKTDSGATGKPCDDKHKCGAGLVCDEGTCHVDCGANVRCDGEVCCQAGDVCYLGTCTTPGADCSAQSATSCIPPRCDFGQQCDPTIGKCMAIPATSCERTPEKAFDPVLYWRWDGSSKYPDYQDVIATPAVMDINDDGAADIIVTVTKFLPGGFTNEGGILCALSGVGDCAGKGKELWCTDPAGTRVNGVASPAIADLDGSGHLVIIAPSHRGGAQGNAYGIVAFDEKGKLIPGFGTDKNGKPVDMWLGAGAPAIADLDHDGKAEVFVGYTVFDSNGKLLWSKPGATGNKNFGPMTVAVDLDDYSSMEIVGGNMAYHADGTEAWDPSVDARKYADGWPAVADFDGDGTPEIAVLSDGTLRVFTNLGMLYAKNTGQVAGSGGPPTIADMNGDGVPDIAVAGSNSLTVFTVGKGPNHELKKLWTMPSRDFSSNITGSSVFDFDGDGRAEVIYGDECFARVYDGKGDGQGATKVRFEVPNTSCTGTEYPVVADISGDGVAEFIVVSNDESGSGSACAPYVQKCIDNYPGYKPTHGVAAYRDKNDHWVSTRAVWNQHAYHVSNVCDGQDDVCTKAENSLGRVPKDEHDSWSFPSTAPINAYRVNAKLSGKLSAPDLVPRNVRFDTSVCYDKMLIKAEVTNLGAIGVPAGISVSFYDVTSGQGSGTLLGTVKTTKALLPGASELVSFTWKNPPDQGTKGVKVRVSVDDDGTGVGQVTECKEDNNAADATGVCSTIQ